MKKGLLGWEFKGKNKDLNSAYAQLQRYAVALENPPLLVVSDMETFVIHTNFTNTVHEYKVLTLHLHAYSKLVLIIRTVLLQWRVIYLAQ